MKRFILTPLLLGLILPLNAELKNTIYYDDSNKINLAQAKLNEKSINYLKETKLIFEKGLYVTESEHPKAKRIISMMNYVLEEDKKNFMAYSFRARAKNVLGKYKEAILDYNKAIKINPKNGMYHHHLGVTKILSGMWKEGCFDLERSAQLSHQYGTTKYQSYCTRYA